MKYLSLVSLFFICSACTSVPKAMADEAYIACQQDQPRLEARSKELATIVKADQDDRENFQKMTPEQMMEMVKRDVPRRKRVGEIFGEGCFRKSSDYAAAALVYQHGDAPDHFFQTFLWAKRAVDLGDKSQKSLMALGIDRYLVSIGQRQLFGSQANKPDMKPGSCWCLQKIEPSFPENLRTEYIGKSLKDQLDWLRELNVGNSCPNTECEADLKSSPRGTVPGFW